MFETNVDIFPVFPHVIKAHFTGVTLTFLEDKMVWEKDDARREMPYAKIRWIELKSLLGSAGINFFAFVSISPGRKGYYGVGNEPIALEWPLYNGQERAEIIKILRTQAPQAQYNDLALAAFRHWF
ncbi:MAG: hypothetical protein JO316_10455 [Abitibacteriaceae bacterium]|nr:hypothetical protein [Abditibacteriaceae bacterium]MBV9865763.1 hypothetical protein [Abditibacteriaceae bacterium]